MPDLECHPVGWPAAVTLFLAWVVLSHRRVTRRVLGWGVLHDTPAVPAEGLLGLGLLTPLALVAVPLAFGHWPAAGLGVLGTAAVAALTAEAVTLRHRLDLLQRRPERREPGTFPNRTRAT